MAPAPPPDERVLVLVPVCGGTLDGLLDLGTSIEPSALESQRAQHFPPRLDEVEVGRILWLEHELPAWVGQGEQQHVHQPVDKVGRPAIRYIMQWASITFAPNMMWPARCCGTLSTGCHAAVDVECYRC